MVVSHSDGQRQADYEVLKRILPTEQQSPLDILIKHFEFRTQVDMQEDDKRYLRNYLTGEIAIPNPDFINNNLQKMEMMNGSHSLIKNSSSGFGLLRTLQRSPNSRNITRH
jgi:hypothetical protein